MEMTAAFSTNDGKTFVNKHPGDALFLDIYTISETKTVFLKRLENTAPEEKKHAQDDRMTNAVVLQLP